MPSGDLGVLISSAMNELATVFLLANAAVLLALPRQWAPLPMLVGTCYMTPGPGIEVGGFSFNIVRILILVGFIRVLFRGERPVGGMNNMDWLMLAWGGWALCTSVFHQAPKDALVFRTGFVYNTLGVYFLIRCFCRSLEDAAGLARSTAILLVPVALEMLNEQITGHNVFAMFGGVAESPEIREGRLRSQGPFAHAILAGTVGAVCAPLVLGVRRERPGFATVGLSACVVMVFTSASSGPIMSLLVGLFGLLLWRWRHLTRHMRLAAVMGYLLLAVVMKSPPYYLLARIDLTGGSSGWHRAELIDSSIRHLREWWFAGTDYTRHWMPTGVSWSPDHTDITNYYLHVGVVGGLPLLVGLIVMQAVAFHYVGRACKLYAAVDGDPFLAWSLGASLFAHVATSISVSYWDQSYVFVYVCMATISCVRQVSGEAADSDLRNRDGGLEAVASASMHAGWDQAATIGKLVRKGHGAVPAESINLR